ncbi:MAG: HAMP domain-containing histidine kinase [Lysobacter sp.]|nr:HAMP domain-containing histidine kinase [Lysobacter sp.]
MRRRLAIGSALSIACVLSALFVILDVWIDREIYSRMDQILLERSRLIEHMLEARHATELQRTMREYDPEGHTQFFAVFDARGRSLARLSSTGDAILSKGPERDGTPRYYDLVLPDGHSGRALARRLPGADSPDASHLLVVASERESWDRVERRVHFALLFGAVAASALAIALGLLVTQTLFAVLDKSGAHVAALDAQAPPHPIGGDFPREFAPFADAFNTGLRRLYQAVERERRFARDVAHELRTPLSEIRATAESALADEDHRRLRESLHAAVDASERMQRSVDTLLMLSRLESGLDAPAVDPLDLAESVGALLEAARPTLLARALTLRCDMPASAWVQSDIGIVERILANMLNNAIEYAPRGSELGCRLHRDDAGWRLTIDNAAPELTDEDLSHFGHRFWRKTPEGGTARHTGLGLALALEMAKTLALPLRFEHRDGRLRAHLGPWPSL